MSDTASNLTRLFHPTAASWYDVPASEVEKWTAMGWLDSKPEGFDDEAEAAIALGEGSAAPVTDSRPDVPSDVPGNNASTEAWKQYAIAQGATVDQVEGKSRNEIRDEFGPSAE